LIKFFQTKKEKGKKKGKEMKQTEEKETNLSKDGAGENITSPLTFCGGAFLKRNLIRNGNPLTSLIFISAGISLFSEGEELIPSSEIKIEENFYEIWGEDSEGLKIFDENDKRISSRALPVVDWRKKNIIASVTLILGEYGSEKIHKIGELTQGDVNGNRYKAAQKALLEYILKDWRATQEATNQEGEEEGEEEERENDDTE
jgi:hypothetical protein